MMSGDLIEHGAEQKLRLHMSEQPNAGWLHAELSMARWYVDAALGAPSAALAHEFVKTAWGVCNGIASAAAALAETALTSEERSRIEEGLASVRRRLQSFDGGATELK